MANETPTPLPPKHDNPNPTTIRLPEATLLGLDRIKRITGLSRNALVGHALKGYVKYVEEHQQLPPER